MRKLPGCWADAYIGIPFRDRGASHQGCDCWGLCDLLYRELCGIVLPDYSAIPPGANIAKLKAIMAAAAGNDWVGVLPGSEREFDVVLMRGVMKDDGGRLHSRPIHIGLVVQPGRLIHVEARTGVSVVDYRTHPAIKCRVAGFYRYLAAPC